MKISLSLDELMQYVYSQINNLFPDNKSKDLLDYKKELIFTIERLEHCFKNIKKDNYNKAGQTYFNYLNADQYTMFLWFLSNTIWSNTHNFNICDKLFYTNKALNGFSCMYDTELPDIFLLLHTKGTVLGKAKYSNYFIAAQGCTVGAHHGFYPNIGEYVSMLTNSSIVGSCRIDDNVSIGINALVYNTNIKNNTVVYVDNNGVTNYKVKEKSWAENWFV